MCDQNKVKNTCIEMMMVDSVTKVYHQYISKQWREFVVFIFNIVILYYNRGHGFTFQKKKKIISGISDSVYVDEHFIFGVAKPNKKTSKTYRLNEQKKTERYNNNTTLLITGNNKHYFQFSFFFYLKMLEIKHDYCIVKSNLISG